MKNLTLVSLFLILFISIGCNEPTYYRVNSSLYKTDKDSSLTFFDIERKDNTLTVIVSQKDTTIAKDTLVATEYGTLNMEMTMTSGPRFSYEVFSFDTNMVVTIDADI